MRMQVFVRLKPGVLDVQGKAVENGLALAGYAGITDVRVGKLIELQIDAKNEEEAQIKTKQLCEKLLANTIIEDFEIRSL